MASLTANDLMEDALIEAKVISPGESIPSSKAALIFRKLNYLLESWALERLLVYSSVVEDLTLTASQGEYTWGTGGDFTTTRPIRIEGAYVTVGSTDHHLEVKTLDVYRRITSKDTGSIPSILAYSPEYPLMKVYLWPTPESTYTLNVKSWKQLVEFDDRTTAVNLPLGYTRALILTLALEISNMFGQTASQELVATATKAHKVIKNSNVTPIVHMRSDFGHMFGDNSGARITTGPFI
jgi:hypothetical protein